MKAARIIPVALVTGCPQVRPEKCFREKASHAENSQYSKRIQRAIEHAQSPCSKKNFALFWCCFKRPEIDRKHRSAVRLQLRPTLLELKP